MTLNGELNTVSVYSKTTESRDWCESSIMCMYACAVVCVCASGVRACKRRSDHWVSLVRLFRRKV